LRVTGLGLGTDDSRIRNRGFGNGDDDGNGNPYGETGNGPRNDKATIPSPWAKKNAALKLSSNGIGCLVCCGRVVWPPLGF